jgi:hypothetical protein
VLGRSAPGKKRVAQIFSMSNVTQQRLTAVGIRCADHVTPLYPQKLALTSTGGGRSVGIVRSRAKAMEFSFNVTQFSLPVLDLYQ